MIFIRIFTKISLVLYFSYFSYGNVLAQTNECPEIPSQQLTISPKEIPLFTTPESNGEIAYIAKDNETLQLLEPTAQYIDGICWYRIQPPDGIPQSELWLATQKEEETPENPVSTPIPKTSKPRTNAIPPEIKTEPILVPKKQNRQTPQKVNKPSQNHPADIPSKTQKVEITNDNDQLIIIYILMTFVGLSFLGCIVSLFYCLSLNHHSKKQIKLLQDNLALFKKQARKLQEMSDKIRELEIQVSSKERILSTNSLDLQIINFLTRNGHTNLTDLLANLPCSEQQLKSRLVTLQNEELISLVEPSETQFPVYRMA
ncbi:MAG: hypothetical protein ACRC6M_12985 [Microcystaceae cyanobacterium]